MKKIFIIFIMALIIVGGSAFYGGMKYEQSQAAAGPTKGNFRNFSNLSPEEQQQRLQQLGGGFGNRAGSDFATGEIISKDDKSIIIKLQNSGSKIIFYSDTTEVGKFVNGTPSDLEVGKTVAVNGKANQDGSITAQSIQLRPVITTPTP